jgi:cation transport ATPase
MLTGDNQRTARAVAGQVGIEEVHAQIVPQDKAARVRTLQEQGAQVAMVGDGINDAPALMQAHVGIAIGAGTDIAIESSDIVLIGERLGAVPEAITIGGMSYRKTVQNLWLAFFFNGVGVPLAATGVVHPSWAMAAMAASVTLVLANSFGGRVFTRSKAQTDHVPERPSSGPPKEAGLAQADGALTLSVPSIHCQGCVETIEANLRLEPGIGRIEGDVRSKTLRVTYNDSDTSPDTIEAAVTRLGHRVEKRSA